MPELYDLVIRNGTLVDGGGGAPFTADIALQNGRIAAVGDCPGSSAEDIDATGKLVTPGFVDIHTHYDGHVTWAEHLNPSAVHGVTTAVMGNCGVGFAPCHARDRAKLLALMEGVEDIPGVVMAAGLPWNWETFPDYLDALETRQFDMDVAAQLPHAALRVYVMGDRAIARNEATADDIAQMASIAGQAMQAGALGFSTSRSINHKALDGSLTPSYAAALNELTGIAQAVRDSGGGVLQLISDFDDAEAEFAIIRAMARTGAPISISLMQFAHVPTLWSDILGKVARANQDGLRVKAQVCGRPVGGLLGLELSYNPFSFCPAYIEIAELPLAAQLAALREPERRRRILAEFPVPALPPVANNLQNLANMFLMSDPPDYEPSARDSIAAEAARRGVTPADYAYDLLLENGGKNIIYSPAANYAGLSIGAVKTMLNHPDTILGLGDGGAHCGIICDASFTTTMLTRWALGNDDHRIPLETVVKRLTSDNAEAVNLTDRGRISPGYKADINIIDPAKLALHRPQMVYDLPEGGGRLHQRASGYDATIVSGAVTYRHGVATGALPGRLVRHGQTRRDPSVTH